MLIVVDPHSGVPVYRQIIDQVKFHVAGGLVSAGDELPSTRSLAARLGVNPMTVSKAYSLLEHDGVVERRPGLALTIKASPPHDLEREKIEQLRHALLPAATIARQLGLGNKRALKVFRNLLDGTEEDEE